MSSSVINAVVVTNPFDPVNNHSRFEMNYEEGKTFAAYVGDLDRGWATSLNGEMVEPEQWYLIYPKRGDTIVVSAVPYGGGGGSKGILRFVAVVALAYVTGGIAAGNLLAGFTGGAGAAATATAAAVSIGGSMIINAVLPPATPDVNDDRDIADSPTYGQDQARNTSESGIPIPLCYGRYRVAGNIVSSYVENINDEQFLYILYNAGEGQIAGFDDIQVNDQPIANFSEVSYQTRTGTSNQSAIGWFDSVRRQYNVGATLRSGVWRKYTFRDLSDRASLEITFPGGLFGIDEGNGDKYEVSVDIVMQWRIYDPNQGENAGWEPLPWLRDNGSIAQGNYRVTAKQTSAIRRTIKTGNLGDNVTLEIRARRLRETDDDYITDGVALSTVTEISAERVRYKNTALVGLRILMSEQLSSVPTVTYINRGILANVWNGNGFSRRATNNPAWIAYDILSNERYGAGIPAEYLILDKFIEWGAWCEDQGLTFNGVLDTASNAFEILEPVMRLGHAKLFTIGTRISVTIEKPDFPVMLFSQANMIKDSFSINWMSVSDRANEVEVTYFDENYDYESRTVKIYDDISLRNGDPQRPTSFTLVGCVTESNAYYEGLLAINYNKYVTQTYSFEASVDAIACTLGSVVYIQHDMPQWGYAGRLQGVNTVDRVNIDIDPADMETFPEIIMVHLSAVSQGKGKIIDRMGYVITVDFVLPNTRADRINIAGRDYPIGGIEILASTTRIQLSQDLMGFINESVEVWETDVFEERAITDITDGVVTVDSPFTQAPERYSQYLIGRLASIKKRARILGIDYSDDHTRQITAIEYNESVYDRDTPFTPSPTQPDLGVIEDTELSNIDEELIYIGKSIRPRLTISYRNPSTRYQTTQVYISTGGSAYRLVDTHRRQITFESEDNAVLDIKLVPVDSGGIVKSIESVEPVRYTVLGKTAPPRNVTNFEITKEVGGLNLTWDANTEIDIEGYEIRRGTSWNDGEIVTQALSSTLLFFPVSVPGAYEFMIRAVDTSGNLSTDPTFARIDLIRPDRVYNFNAVQHIDKVIMQWDRPVDRNITSFWIREGTTWANSVILGSVTGTTFEVQATTSGDRTFWIKAVDIIGIDSEDAVFATTAVADLPDRNQIYRIDHGGTYPAPGVRLNVSGSNPIQLNDGVNYGEYSIELALPYSTRARNSSLLTVGVSVTNSTTWGDANYAWDSPESNSGWAGVGDPEKIDFKQYLATKYSGAPQFYPGTAYLFSLNNTLVCDVTGITPDYSRGVDYAPARYNMGAYVGATTDIKWTIAGTDSWTTCSWVRVPTVITSDLSGVAGRITLDGQPPIYLILSGVNQQIIARQSGFPDLVSENIVPKPGDVFFVGISQQGGERILRVRNLAEDTTRKSVLYVSGTMRPNGIGLGFGN